MMIEEMDVEAVRAMLAPLWARNRDHVLERLQHARLALTSAKAPTDADHTDIHALIGTLGTYGWPEGSALLETIRLHLRDRDDSTESAATTSDLTAQLDDLIVTLSSS